MSAPESSQLSVSLHTGAGLWVICHAYDDVTPILSLSGSGVHLTVSPAARAAVTTGDVATARELVEAATVYLRECERLAGTTSPQVAA